MSIVEDEALRCLAGTNPAVAPFLAPFPPEPQVQRRLRIERLPVTIQIDDPMDHRLLCAVGQAFAAGTVGCDSPDVKLVIEKHGRVLLEPSPDPMRRQEVGRGVVGRVGKDRRETGGQVSLFSRAEIQGPVVLSVEGEEVVAARALPGVAHPFEHLLPRPRRQVHGPGVVVGPAEHGSPWIGRRDLLDPMAPPFEELGGFQEVRPDLYHVVALGVPHRQERPSFVG